MKVLRGWMMLVATAVALGGGIAYSAGFCEDCEPCMCLPDGSYGMCCYGPYPCP